jgi:biofilm PGA synthesis N-glycosyltransferase PgaC
MRVNGLQGRVMPTLTNGIREFHGELPSYALVTPARNERRFIEQTIQSVASQTIKPRKWVIVSDGSTDGTDEIVQKYLPEYSWLELVRRADDGKRNFAGKVQSFNAGIARLGDTAYDIVGNLDADITFDHDYMEFLLSKFLEDPQLGVAGTPFIERAGTSAVQGQTSYDYRFTSLQHVSGACQLFRRGCFEEIGGYVPIAGGGIDWIAVTTARMKGWRTRTFSDKVCLHHRPMGTATAGRLRAWLNQGRQDYYLGGHPLWQLFRAAYQMTREPYVLGGLYLWWGYVWAHLTGVKSPVSPELIRFHRKEQMARLREMFARPPGLQ